LIGNLITNQGLWILIEILEKNNHSLKVITLYNNLFIDDDELLADLEDFLK
jgi:hypothetical protein